MNQHITHVVDYFGSRASKNCTIHIGHQITDGSIPVEVKNPYIYYYPMYDRGLSKNRNQILSHIDDGICVVCDDDVMLHPQIIQTIMRAYDETGADCITFQSQTPTGNPRKNYSGKRKKHNKISILSVSSIEMTFDIKKIHEKHITFDERFGLGAEIASGEENIFLSDCMRDKLMTLYYPKPITIHPKESSGNSGNIDIQQKRKIFMRMGFCATLSFVMSYYLYMRRKSKI